MPPIDKPAAEVDIDEALVRVLLRAQHPDLADRPLTLVAAGWDNVVYRLGDDLSIRLPRRAIAAELVANELRWLPTLAAQLPLPIAEPLRAGEPQPDDGYPFPWSVCRWIVGRVALETPLDDLAAAATALGRFLAALHRPSPPDAPVSPFRGIPLAGRHDRLVANLSELGDLVDGTRLRAIWDDVSTGPAWPHPPTWVHGDVHPGNLVVADGRLAGVVDFGDLTAGDPATDLSVAWMLFPAALRPAFRAAAGERRPVDDDTWARAEAWALALGVVILANSADAPAFAALGRRTIDAVLAGN